MTDQPRKIVVAGAGLAGALLATQLGRKGHEVVLLERRGDPRTAEGAARGRSINLAISVRGLHALKTIGLDEAVLAEGVRMPGRMIHGLQGDPIFQPYSADPTRAINSVSRGGLNALLLNAAEQEQTVSIHFKRRLVDIDWTTDPQRPAAIVIDDATGQTERFDGDLVIASDGAYSAARIAMQKTEGFDYSQTYLSHGYKELTIPPKADGSWAMAPEALHIWPRGGYMMIALPNRDRSFTCTIFLAHDRGRGGPGGGEDSFEAIPDEEAATAFFVRRFPDALPLMPDFRREFRDNPVGSMVTVRCRPWHRGRIALLGDAAHAIVPFYGQGANCAFEDCVAMVEALERHANDLDAAIADYERARCENADAIAELAQINFIEMRDHTASSWFRARKKLEQGLNKLFPKLFLPLYDMVSFSTIPYAAARKRAKRQWIAVGVVAVLVTALVVVVVVLALVAMLRSARGG